MSVKFQNALHDLLVSLGLRERPKLQPIPVRHDEPDRSSKSRRRR